MRPGSMRGGLGSLSDPKSPRVNAAAARALHSMPPLTFARMSAAAPRALPSMPPFKPASPRRHRPRDRHRLVPRQRPLHPDQQPIRPLDQERVPRQPLLLEPPAALALVREP